MKFARELEQDLVPEWHAKYLNYKEGKKLVKAVTRAVARASGTPRLLNRDTFFFRQQNKSPLNTYDGSAEIPSREPFRESPAALGANSHQESEDSSGDQKVTTPMLMGRRKGKKDSNDQLRYGSFVGTPPSSSEPAQALELPGPALSSDSDVQCSRGTVTPNPAQSTTAKSRPPLHTIRSYSVGTSGSAYEIGQTIPSSHRSSTFNPITNRSTQLGPRLMSTPSGPVGASPRAFQHRVMSSAITNSPKTDVSLPALDQVRARQQEFFKWMDKELEMIETFYKSKEDEAGDRLKILREQLHEMRNRRIDEIAEARKAKEIRKDDEHAFIDPFNHKDHLTGFSGNSRPRARDQAHAWMQPFENAIQNAKALTKGPQPGPNSRALENMQRTPEMLSRGDMNNRQRDDGRDYVRRPTHDHNIPYRSAKRKLKLALKEYYRGLELLKSYALLNRTAFRKINKKYDKAVNARPPLRYMSEKVNKAWFVQSDVLEGHIHAVEDIYSRYFERGNHKVAVGKLRGSAARQREHTGSAFQSGLFIGSGAVFAIRGLVYAIDLLFNSTDPTIQLHTSYLLQIYGGYFLALYLFSWFCLDCCIWTRNKINYVFVFEFDPLNHLDWRELAEFPAFLLLILGLFLWLNFSSYGAPEMFLYYPVILIFVTVVTLFLPAPILYHRSRRWFVYAHWRLLLAGLYPVEFRDFFLGDMYCSLTYFMSNIELFFCLYAQYWSNPTQCNSTNSRLLGFFSTLPGIWRALQCVRRYYDTGSVFPHLLNCGKYSMTIVYYITLSLYRIDNNTSLLALFITFATINALYCSTWDLAMDWSLCQPGAQKRFLRNVRAYKPTWPYYLAMILDPILRFNWIFYVAYTHDLQHSSIASFLIAFSEVSRRGMWTLFRVENEHCANVAHFKASRDIPLPYPLSPEMEADTFAGQHPGSESPEAQATTTQSSPALSRYRSRTAAAEEGDSAGAPSSGLRHRAPTRTLTSMFAEAHTQDFEKKRRREAGDSGVISNLRRHRTGSDDDCRVVSSDDEDDEEDAMHLLDVEGLERSKGREEE